MEHVHPGSMAVDDAVRGSLMTMIRESVIALCRQGLPDGSSIEQVEGLIGITLHTQQVFLINIGEKLRSQDSTAVVTTPCVSLGIAEKNSKDFLSLERPQSEKSQDASQQLAEIADCKMTFPKPTAVQSRNIVNLQSCSSAVISGTTTMLHSPTLTSETEHADQFDDYVPFVKDEHLVEHEEEDEDLEKREENEDVSDSETKTDRQHPSASFQYFSQGSSSRYISPIDSLSRMLPPSHSGYLRSTSTSSRNQTFTSSLPQNIPGSSVASYQASDAGISGGSDEQLILECLDVQSAGGEMEKYNDGEAQPRPLSCRLCNASFSKKFCLENHIVAIHQVGGRYVCHTCGRQFQQRLRYVTHIDRHNNVRRHVCESCGKAFTYKYSLWSHTRKWHCQSVTDHRQRQPVVSKSGPTSPHDG